jgi:phosphoglycerate dehydrogenase-like enzyme
VKLVIHPPVEAERLARIVAAAAPMAVVNAADEAEALQHLHDADAFFGKLTPHLLAAAPRLRWVQAPTASLEHYVFPALAAHPCVLTNMRGLFSDVIADQVLGYVLCFARNLHVYVLRAAEARWAPVGGEAARVAFASGPGTVNAIDRAHRHLGGATLGVVGLGAIGVEVANAALKLGMNVLGYDPTITVQHAWQLSSGVQKAVNLDDLFARSDVVTVHVPLTKSTDKLVNGARLEAMRRGGVVLNFSREAIVDTEAVLAALGAGKIRAYVTDFPTRALLDHPKVICLPHLGASTVEAEENCAVMVVDNVREFLENGNVTRSVNFPETVLQRTRPNRVAIPHKNVPNMVAQILTCLAAQDINIADMLNHSRDELSYTLVDLDAAPSEATLDRIRGIDGILSVRVLPVIDV